ncbi:MAG TPA: tRNA lysidine(34) synthetase TilS [Burkholderiaceae bacterium]|nr:tRNA lysidine(34) synthetase TilS [Burkholderiaceae bacterium]
MASTRKRSPKAKEKIEQVLLDLVRDAVANAAAATAKRAARRAAPLLVAFSGGRDSSVLLDLVVRLRNARVAGFARPIAVHVHHGMQAAADRWLEHCRTVCAAHDVQLAVRHVAVQTRGRGPEAAAREARYGALAAVAHELNAPLILTAHHLDDRIETFLIQWLRGAGVDGLAAMPATRPLADAAQAEEASENVHIVRPLLQAPRADLERYARLRELVYIEDPSNQDPRLLRSSLRQHVLPALYAARPGFARAAARSIDLVAEAAETLREAGRIDLARCIEDAPAGMLRLDRLQQLSPPRQTGVLRAWLAARGVMAPPRARLMEMLQQALEARSDSRLRLRVGTQTVRRYRGLLLLREEARKAGGAVAIAWNGEAEIPVPAWGGALRFIATPGPGFDAAWLQAKALELRSRTGGERFKPHPTRPSKRLKQLYQEAGVPEFERAALPLVWRDGELIFAAGLGADVRWLEEDGERIRLEWAPDAQLIE